MHLRRYYACSENLEAHFQIVPGERDRENSARQKKSDYLLVYWRPLLDIDNKHRKWQRAGIIQAKNWSKCNVLPHFDVQ